MSIFQDSRQRFYRKITALILLASLLLPPAPAWAGIATTTFTVSATVLSACIVAATNMAFGNYTSSSTSPATATSLVTVTCTLGTTYTVALNAGTGTGATVAARLLTNGSNTLNYGLYTNSNYTTVWGDGTSSTATNGGTAGALPTVYTVYGQIPAGQYTTPGIYSDVITVSVNY